MQSLRTMLEVRCSGGRLLHGDAGIARGFSLQVQTSAGSNNHAAAGSKPARGQTSAAAPSSTDLRTHPTCRRHPDTRRSVSARCQECDVSLTADGATPRLHPTHEKGHSGPARPPTSATVVAASELLRAPARRQNRHSGRFGLSGQKHYLEANKLLISFNKNLCLRLIYTLRYPGVEAKISS